MNGEDRLWTVAELAAFLQKPKSWVYDNYRDLFPYYKIGQQVRFAPGEIRAALREMIRTEKGVA
ncbi:helix-turn-helix domain-containing protein [Actinomadura soli]|uniref:Helix-turn-helix domain-containing protein n=1 Tax=Actinomadura soli TaxID=2508997 RepID=A0A5C4IXU7_9ACTN|nr:helix-turn-helix domain-containing protein [Actinomadura soli]TMQ79969.1 helix-turn-helix domain-containing protein [Actinomadura soli]